MIPLVLLTAAHQIMQGACSLRMSLLHLLAGRRWYAGAVVLQDGRIFVAGGSHGEGGGYVSPVSMWGAPLFVIVAGGPHSALQALAV